MGSEQLDYLKEDGTMYLLLVFFLFHAIVAEECPLEKRVGDICYTRVAMSPTHQYGCIENCTYKKTSGPDTGLYCFKTGSLQVTACGAGPIEPGFDIGVTCGSGLEEEHCFQCGKDKDVCQGLSPMSDCVFTDNSNCIPRPTTNEFDFGQYMGFLNEALVEFEDNTNSDILFPSADSCSFFQKIKCLTELGVGLAGCVSCKLNPTCWISCLKDKICGLSSYCLPGGPCFDDLFGKISSVLRNIGLPPQEIKEILEALRNFVCSK